MTLVRLCAAAEVPADMPMRAEHDGYSYAVFRAGDRYHVTDDVCTHGPGLLSEGTVLGEEIECPFHQGRFSILTGEPTLPPCTEAIKVWTVHLAEDGIWIEPGEHG